MSVGTHALTRHYTPIEVGRTLDKAIRAGASLSQCADALELGSTSMVSRFLCLLKLGPDIQHLVDWGQSGATISFTAAWRLTQLSLTDQRQATRFILENQLTSPEVEQLIQLRRRSGNSVSSCVEAVLRMRTVVERRYVFIGKIASQTLHEKLNDMVQSQRDTLLNSVVHDRFPDLAEFAARLGVNRFTIVANSKSAAILKRSGNFEAIINAALLRREVVK